VTKSFRKKTTPVPVDPPLSPRMPADMARDAVNKVVTELHQKGALDAGNGDVLDPWLDSLRPQWIAHHVVAGAESEAEAHLAAGELEAAAAGARHPAEAAKAERDDTQRVLAIFEQRLVTPNEAPAMDHADRRRRPRPSLDALEGLTTEGPWRFVSKLLLLLAMAGDLASFYVALAGSMPVAPWVVITLTVALTAVAVGVIHAVGRTARNLREGHGGLGRPALVVMTTGWVALGAAAFYVRLQSVEVSDAPFPSGQDVAAAGDSQGPLLQAVLLAALYIGSGILAYWIGFSDHRPRMQQYLNLRRRLVDQDEDVAKTEQIAIRAERLLDNARAEVLRTAARTAAAEASVEAEIAELKELTRIHVAGLLGEPAATNNLITGRGRSAFVPPNGDGTYIPRPSAPLHVPPGSINGNGHPATAH
jgi:hypothetical protein